MKHFKPLSPCPKCGSLEKKVKLWQAVASQPEEYQPDYLTIDCLSCTYQYTALPLDAPKDHDEKEG